MTKYLTLFLLLLALGCHGSQPIGPDFWLDPPAALWQNPPDDSYVFCPVIERWALPMDCAKCHVP